MLELTGTRTGVMSAKQINRNRAHLNVAGPYVSDPGSLKIEK